METQFARTHGLGQAAWAQRLVVGIGIPETPNLELQTLEPRKRKALNPKLHRKLKSPQFFGGPRALETVGHGRLLVTQALRRATWKDLRE